MMYHKVAMKPHELELHSVERKTTESDLERERVIGFVKFAVWPTMHTELFASDAMPQERNKAQLASLA